MAALAAGLRASVWLEHGKFEEAEGRYQQALGCRRTEVPVDGTKSGGVSSGISDSIEATMTIIQQSLSAKTQTGHRMDLGQRVSVLEKENLQLKKALQSVIGRVAVLEARLGITVEKKDEDNFDLFGVDEEEEEAEPVQKVEQKSRSKKPPVVAKSTIVLDVKPWDTETDMKEMERLVRGIATDGLLWGASKLAPVAFGIMKLQISCVVEDEKVGTDFLEEQITSFEDYVQSVDVVSFNKL